MLSLGDDAILFGHPDCPGCKEQHKLLDKHFSKIGNRKIKYYNLKKNKVPECLLDKNGNYTMPTWYLPTGKGKGKLFKNIITDPRKFTVLVISKQNKFGAEIPEIGKVSKTFPNGEGFDIGKSFANEIEDKWGKGESALRSGTFERELGPDNTGTELTNNYFYQPRMAHPSGDLATALGNNRKCNIVNNPKASSMNPGLITDSKNPQIVGFGKRKLRFGPTNRDYSLMVDKLAGATNKTINRPFKVKNDTWIGSGYKYMNGMARSANSFGKKPIKQVKPDKLSKVGPGSVITIKNGKVKVKN